MNSIGNRIREIRGGKTTREFADILGVTNAIVSLWENGKRNVPDRTIKQISDKFLVSEELLRTGEGDRLTKKPREEQIREYFKDLEGLNEEFKKRFISALAAIRPEDWTIIQQLVEKIVRENETREAAEEPQKKADIHIVQAAHPRTDTVIPEGVDTSDDEFFD